MAFSILTVSICPESVGCLGGTNPVSSTGS